MAKRTRITGDWEKDRKAAQEEEKKKEEQERREREKRINEQAKTVRSTDRVTGDWEHDQAVVRARLAPYSRANLSREAARQKRSESLLDQQTANERTARAALDLYSARSDAEKYAQMNRVGQKTYDKDTVDRSVIGFEAAQRRWKQVYDANKGPAAVDPKTSRQSEIRSSEAKIQRYTDTATRGDTGSGNRYEGVTGNLTRLGRMQRYLDTPGSGAGNQEAWQARRNAAETRREYQKELEAAKIQNEEKKQPEQSVYQRFAEAEASRRGAERSNSYWTQAAQDAAWFGDLDRLDQSLQHVDESRRKYAGATAQSLRAGDELSSAYQDEQRNLRNNDLAAYYAQNLSDEEIARRLEQERRPVSVTDEDRANYPGMYPDAAFRTMPRQSSFDPTMTSGGEEPGDRFHMSDEERRLTEESDRYLLQQKVNDREVQIAALERAQQAHHERDLEQEVYGYALSGRLSDMAKQGQDAMRQDMSNAQAHGNNPMDVLAQSGSAEEALALFRGASAVTTIWRNLTKCSDEQKERVYAMYSVDPQKAVELSQKYYDDAMDAYYAQFYNWANSKHGWQAGRRLAAGLLGTGAKLLSGFDPFGDAGQDLSRAGEAFIGGASESASRNGLFGIEVLGGDESPISGNVPYIGRGRAGEAEQLGTSILESSAIAVPAMLIGRYDVAASKVAGLLGTTLMGSSAAADDYRESIRNGLTDSQAIAHATAAGIAEAAFEYISLDRLIDPGNIKKGLIRWLTQGGIEASEEVCTTIANRISDEVIANFSGIRNSIEREALEYQIHGYSAEEAEAKAQNQWLSGLLMDGLGGFMSGLIMGGGSEAIQSATGKIANTMVEDIKDYRSGSLLGLESAGYTNTDTMSALSSYAEANGIDVRGLTDVQEKALERLHEQAETTVPVQEQTQTETEKVNQDQAPTEQAAETAETAETADTPQFSRRELRKAGKVRSQIVNSITQKFEGQTAAEKAAQYDSLVEQYGSGIEAVATEALYNASRQDMRTVTDVTTLEQRHGTDAAAFTSETARQTMERAYRDTQQIIMRETGDTTRSSMDSLAALNRNLRKTDGATLNLQAEVTGEDGGTKTVSVRSFDNEGKRVVLEDGSKVDVKDLKTDADTKSFLQAMQEAELGEYTNEALQTFLDTGTEQTLADGIEWITGYRGAFGVGEVRGNITNAIQLAARYGLDTDTAAAAYYQGVKASDALVAQSKQTLANAQEMAKGQKQTVTGRRSNIDVSGIEGVNMTNEERRQFNFANKIFSMIGVELRWVASDEKNGRFVGANGSYLHGVVTLDIHAGRNFLRDVNSGILATTGHELTHFLQEYAPEQYRALKEFLFQQIVQGSANGEARLERLIWEKQRRASSKLSRRAAQDEVVADACQTMLRDSKAIREFAQQDEEAAKGIARWLDKWFGKLKQAFSRSAQLTEEARFVDSFAKDVREAFGKLWDEALREAVETNDRVGNIEKTQQQNSDRDAEYLELAKDPEKNAARLQEMVDEAAKQAGYTIKAYHGTPKKFNVFSKARIGSTTDYGWFGRGFYFTDKQDVASVYAGYLNDSNVIEAYLNVQNPFDFNEYPGAEDMTAGQIMEDAMGKKYGRRGEMTEDDKAQRSEDFTNWLRENKYDGVRAWSQIMILDSEQAKRTAPVTYDDNGNVIPLSERFNAKNEDIRYSERDNAYRSAVDSGDLEAARKMVEDAANEAGYTIHAYHGTSRGDRVGNVFRPERATSGPMAFFTSDKAIADNYAKGKADTSIAYDTDYDTYETQFRATTRKGAKYPLDMKIEKAWGYIDITKRNEIREKAGQLRFDWDGDDDTAFILDPSNKEAGGGFQWQLKEARGNVIKALIEQWLNSGNLFDQESRFLQVLDMVGVTEQLNKVGIDVVYKDPNYREEKTYDVFLKMTRPFNTAKVNNRFIENMLKWYDKQPYGKYDRESVEADMWDKNSVTMEAFAERLRDDLENETTHAWTSIPDSVTDYLKHLKYDGIIDKGGKYSGLEHTVYIPFSSEQVKSAETAVYDDNGNVIPLSERFNETNEDIRYSERDYSAPSDEELLMNARVEDAESPETRAALQNSQKQARQIRDLTRRLEHLQTEIRGYEGDSPNRISVQRFTRQALDLFGIPSGMRTDMGELLQSVAEGVLAGHNLSQNDIMYFFETLITNGREKTVADETLAEIRDDLKGRKIYVNENVKAEFGDDWNAFRKRAFSLGIQLTNNEKNMGIDSVNAELAELYPGKFDANETDLRSILENMVDTAESGKTSDVPILDAMREIQNQTGEPVREQLQTMLDQFTRQIEIMQDQAAVERKARAGNAAEIAKARKQISEAKEALREVRKQRDAWKRKSKGADARQKRALDAALRGVVQHDEKQIAEAVRQKQALAKKLQDQIDREKKILSGKLRSPGLVKLLKAEREKAEARVKEQKEAQFARYKEGKKAGELRGRIKNLSDEMKRRMTRPTDGAYVPASLYGSMTKLADVLDTVLAPNPGTKAETRYRSMMDAIHSLAAEYDGIKNLDDYTYASEFDQEIRDQISELERVLNKDRSWTDELTGDGKRVGDMSLTELQQTYDILRQINQTMKNAAKLMNNQKLGSLYDAMRNVADQQAGMRSRNASNAFTRGMRNWRLDTMSTMRAVEKMSGWDRNAALYQLMQGIEQGVVDSDIWMMNYNKRMEALKTGKNELEYRKALSKKLDYGVKDTKDGIPVMMTKLQALQILMTAEREAANDKLVHLQKGGAEIRDAVKIQEGKAAKATSYHIDVTPELIQKIRDSLTEWDKQYMQTVHDYFKTESREMNKILYSLKNRVLETEESYVPYIVDSNYLETKLTEQQAMNMWVKTPGSTNALKTKASQPVIIDGMDTVMAKHVRESADYIGLALPIRDFSKVYNGMLSQGEGEIALPVKKTIADNWGDKGAKLLTDAVLDVQGSSRVGSYNTAIAAYLNKLQSGFVKSALLINPSVTIKQAASYIAAESVLSHRALIAGNRPLFTGQDASHSPSLIAQIFAAPSGSTATRIYNEIDEHTSMHYVRRQGMSYTELANEANRQGWLKRNTGMMGAKMEQNAAGHFVRKAGQVLNPVQWIQRMDVATTAALWVACKEQAKMDGMEVGSSEYWQRTTELYEQALRETQPMYDNLHRTNMQKEKTGLMQFLFPFRTVPVQNHGQIAASFDAMLAAKGKSREEQIDAYKHFAKTVWAQTESAVIFSVMTFLAAGLKRKTGKYRDEDDEISPESILKGILSDTGGVWLSNILPMTGSEIWSWGSKAINSLKGVPNGYTFDTFSVGVVDMLNDLDTAADRMFKASGKLSRGEISFGEFAKTGDSFLSTFAKIFGIPAPTIKTYAEGLWGDVQDIREGRIPAYNDDAVERKNSTNARRFTKAWNAKDEAKMNAVLEEMFGSMVRTSDEAQSARNALSAAAKEAYQTGKMDLEEYVEYLEKTEAFTSKGITTRVSTMLKEDFIAGKRTAEETVELLVKYKDYKGNPEQKAWAAVKEWAAKAEHDDEDDYDWNQYDELKAAIAAGEGVQDEIQELKDHGYTQKQINDALKKSIQEAFTAGNYTEGEAIDALVRYGVTFSQNGKTVAYDQDKGWQAVREWAAKAGHEDDEDFSYSLYDNLRDAVAAGKGIDAAMKELTDHGVKEADVNDELNKTVMKLYTEGAITEKTAIGLLTKYHTVTKDKKTRPQTADEAWAALQKASAEAAHADEEDYSYSKYDDIDAALDKNADISKLVKQLTDHGEKQANITNHVKSYLIDRYVAGEASESALKNQLSRYCGITKTDEVAGILKDANCKKDCGHGWSDLKNAYGNGDLSASAAKKMLQKHGGLSAQGAEHRLGYWDYCKKNPDTKVSAESWDAYYDKTLPTIGGTLSSRGLKQNSFTEYLEKRARLEITDLDGDGKNDKKAYYVSLIDSLNISSAEKDALYYYENYGAKDLRNMPWH